jgi:hypothetical protein
VSARRRWVQAAINLLLDKRLPWVEVPKDHASAIQRALKDELGIVAKLSHARRKTVRLVRVGVVD